MTKASYFVYVVECRDGTFYTGYATDVLRRIAEHNGEGKAAGARYTRARRPVKLIYQACFSSRSEAMKHEAMIKKFSRKQKEIFLKRNAQPPSLRKKTSAL